MPNKLIIKDDPKNGERERERERNHRFEQGLHCMNRAICSSRLQCVLDATIFVKGGFLSLRKEGREAAVGKERTNTKN